MQRLLSLAVVFLGCLAVPAGLYAEDAVYYTTERGRDWYSKGEYDKAIAEFTEAIRLIQVIRTPDAGRIIATAALYANRGDAWREKGNCDKAIADFNQALAINPKAASFYNGRGDTWSKKGQYDKAVADYDQAIKLDPKHANAYNDLAWLYAACPDEKYRDGKKAFENASKAYQLTKGKSWDYIDTLAAAYAENGDFDKAKEWEAKAIKMATAEKSKEEYRSRLELYKQKKPYREEPRSQAPTPYHVEHLHPSPFSNP